MDSQTGTIECSLFPYFMNNHILYHTHKDSQMDSQTGTIECSLFPYFMNNHIISHSQGLTNGLSDRDCRVLTISLFYVQNTYNNMEYKN